MNAIKTLSYYCLFLFILNLHANADEIENPDCNAVHNVGKLVLKSNLIPPFGGKSEFYEITEEERIDCFNRRQVFEYGAEYPIGSKISILHGGTVIIGGIIDNDTLLVQVEYSPKGMKIYRSTLDPTDSNFENAVSEQDYISVGVDNIEEFFDIYGLRFKPLNIQVTKKSYAWSYEYAEDFVLFDIEIKNIGKETIKKAYTGLVFSSANGYFNGSNYPYLDDLGGYYSHEKSFDDCNNIIDNFDLMWGADNDGDPINEVFTNRLGIVDGQSIKSATSVSGVLFLENLNGKFNEVLNKSCNWYTLEFNPQSKLNYREIKNNLGGAPFTVEDNYHLMSNGEIDYDPMYTASISQIDPTWLYPNQDYAEDISNGIGVISHLLSVGPFDIPPGGVLKIPFAYVAGENFHTIPTNIDNLPDFPSRYYSNLDFSDIVTNAQWARWIYDNPGVDTDGDGDSGLYQICVLDSQLVDGEWTASATDTFWYRGDGIPDWKAAGPPPAPYVWLDATHNGIHVRFNGSRSETEKDIFTRIADFEGYNIYFGRDERETSLSLVASYDKDNYDKFVYDFGVKRYIVQDIPLTLEQILCTYADSCSDSLFDPLIYTRSEPLFKLDSLIFFEKHAFNVEQSAITKVYPNARDPRLVHADSLLVSDYTDDGYFKFFEYEYFIENLLSTVSYWVNVTAFDFGSPKSGLKALETSKVLGIQEAYPLLHTDDLSVERKQVFIYPNPYKINGNYRNLGYEGRTEEDRPDYRVRELNFANLPPKCEIKIFSLDGDLIRHLSHNMPEGDPTNSRHRWDLITRNTQMIVSGLYYWTVEFPDGEVQMGKFVAIM